MQLSIIVPVYNIEDYLDDCLSSLAAQDYQSVEYILVNDGSTDSSGNICDSWAAKDSRFRVLHKSNGGVSAARNTGLTASLGYWIGFVDGDDWLEPDAIGQLMSCLDVYPDADALCFGFFDHYTGDTVMPDSTYIKTGCVPADAALSNILIEGGYFTSVWNKLFRRDMILSTEDPLLFDPSISIGEDEKYLVDALLRCSNCLCVTTPVYHYRYRSNSALNANIITDARIRSLHLKKDIANQLQHLPELYRLATARLYNRAVPLMVSAYCSDLHSLRAIRRCLRGTWLNWLLCRSISAKRKAKVLAVCSMMRLHFPGKLVERVVSIRR